MTMVDIDETTTDRYGVEVYTCRRVAHLGKVEWRMCLWYLNTVKGSKRPPMISWSFWGSKGEAISQGFDLARGIQMQHSPGDPYTVEQMPRQPRPTWWLARLRAVGRTMIIDRYLRR
jgi:hypothetical protein